MKKIMLCLFICGLLLSCNDEAKPGEGKDSTANEVKKDTPIITPQQPIKFTVLTADSAERMIYTFLSSGEVDHSKDAEIQRIQFEISVLTPVFNQYSTDRLRLFTAAYLKGDPKEYQKTILLQLRDAAGINTYFDIYDSDITHNPSQAEGIPICPPPNGVCDLNFTSTLADVKKMLAK